MGSTDLRERTKSFALRIVKLTSALPKGRFGDVIGRQLLKSGTSIGANWREACRASSKRHFVSTSEICLREADERLYWLELLVKAEVVKPTRMTGLMDECNQLVAIFAATIVKAKRGLATRSQQ